VFVLYWSLQHSHGGEFVEQTGAQKKTLSNLAQGRRMRIICRGQHLNSMVEDSHFPIISDNGSGSLSKIARP
jgi:hypothetical protein